MPHSITKNIVNANTQNLKYTEYLTEANNVSYLSRPFWDWSSKRSMSNVISPNFIVSSEPKCLIFVSLESKHNPKCNLWNKSWKYILNFVSKTMEQDRLLQNLKTKNILWFMLLKLKTPKNLVKMKMKYEIKRKCCYSNEKLC